MLAFLTSRWRIRAATLLAALYAFCVLAPVAAMAMSHAGIPAHCLTDDHGAVAAAGHKAAAAHADHHNGANHTHSAPADDPHANPAKCCGLFGVTAIAPPLSIVATPMARVSEVVMPAIANLSGRSASRIDRPPRALPSL